MPLFARLLRFAVTGALFVALGCSNDAGSASRAAGGAGGPAGAGAAAGDGTDAGTPKAPPPPTGDTGFRPATDGFLFPNYADQPGPGVFDSAGLRRMFGDKVCSSIANDACVLTPQGQDWVDKVNTSLQGGHCEGFAVLSLLFYNKWLDPSAFGAGNASGLSLTGNGALNHELAYWYATQFLEDPVITTTHSFKAVDAVSYLLEAFSTAQPDTIARIGLARIGPSGAIEGGHAITPYAVLDGDAPNTKKIMVYDSNHPGEERFIDVDIAANSWSYVAGTNPEEPASLYVGNLTNKNRLYVAAVHPRLGLHTCPFCNEKVGTTGITRAGDGASVPALAKRRSLIVHGDLDPVVQDADGKRVGRVGGEIVNEIPGAVITPGFSGGLWVDNTPLQILLPAGGDFKVSVTPRAVTGVGTGAARSSVTMFGGGYSLGVDYPAGATIVGDTIGMPQDAKGVTLTSVGPSSATLAMAVQTAGGGMVAHIAVANLPAGANVGLQTDAASGTVGVKVDSPTPVDLKMDVGIDKGDGAGKQVFEGNVKSSGADSVGVDLGAWTGGTDPMPISVAPSDGSPPTTVVVDNAHDYTPPAVDECALNLSNCSVDATCTDTPSSFTCACKPGYGGDGVTCTLGAVSAPPPPAAPAIAYGSGSAPALLYTVGKHASQQPPANGGGKIELYAVRPALPDGLVLDPQTGAIAGTPTTVAAATDYAVTATNVTGGSSATLSITVQGPAPKIAYGAGAHLFYRWDPAPVLSPTNSGGPVLEYAIAPALPAGLVFDAASGQISGTPIELSAASSYVVTASNLSGSYPASVTLGVVCSTGVTCATPPGVVLGGRAIGVLSPLVLQNNGGDDLTVAADGTFAFHTSVTPRTTYAVTVLTQPVFPSQTCTVTSGSGTAGLVDVSSVVVTCSTSSFTVGGTITGLAGSVVLQDNAGNDLTVNSSGAFVFSTPLLSGAGYGVTVLSQPKSPVQTCTVTNGNGIVAGGNVASVAISCNTSSFSVGASLSGLVGSGLVLLDNGGDATTVAADATTVTFPTPIASGSAYAITIQEQPAGQTCTVSGGAGTVGSGDVTTAVVNCSRNTYTVGGTITGLAGTAILQNNAGDNLTLNSAGSFAFPTPIASGSSYAVTVLNQPSTPSQTCSVTSGAAGAVGIANITTVAIDCTVNAFAVGGTVTGLAGSVTLQDNAGDNLTLSGSGSFAFAKPVPSGSGYTVTVLTQPSSPSQTCSVASGGSGTVGSGNVTSVNVTCSTNRYAIGGTVSGLSGSVTLQNNAGDDVMVVANGAFVFATSVASGQPYAVSVSATPPGSSCQVSSGSGIVASGDVSNVTVSCTSSAASSTSCKALLAADPTLPSGPYWLTGATPYQTYCDMTTNGGGWTLVMKLAAGDFCADSVSWTSLAPQNEAFMLDAGFPGYNAYDAKSSAFYLVNDATSLRFDTPGGGTVTTWFVSPASAQNLMTTNDVPFAVYPDRVAWRAAFGQDRNQAPIFMRAGVPVTDGNVCRNNPQDTPVGCGQVCMFCYQASDGDCCGCNATQNDVNSGVGNGAAYCGGGLANCSASGQWSNPQGQALIWAR